MFGDLKLGGWVAELVQIGRGVFRTWLRGSKEVGGSKEASPWPEKEFTTSAQETISQTEPVEVNWDPDDSCVLNLPSRPSVGPPAIL
jgi:hypothetical protein